MQQPHAAAQYMAVSPAQQRLAEVVQQMVEAIFLGKELARQFGHLSGAGQALPGQLAHIAAGTKCLAALAAQDHADDLRVSLPDA